MAAEPISTALVNRLSLPGKQVVPKGYYRSKLFIAPFMTNKLVAAAGPLLSLLERLGVSPTLPPIEHIRENIDHELAAFHSRLETNAHTEDAHAMAHYLLCATIDELLGKSYLRLYGQIAEFKAFTSLSLDDIGPEQRFFDIVSYIKERPNQYLDLIELGYYCLIAGFEGVQHGKTDGRQELDNLLEELFQLIQQYRASPIPRLFKASKPQDITKTTNYKPYFAFAVVSVCLLVSTYIISYALLEEKVKNVPIGQSIIAKLDF
jgi:type IV/VI secretion system ImpK/VasF family protein